MVDIIDEEQINKTFLRASEARNILGLTKYQLNAIVYVGSLTKVRLDGMSQSYFRTSEVLNYKKQLESKGNEESG